MSELSKVPSVRARLVRLLVEGSLEVPLWSSFLDALRDEVTADYATMNLRWPGRSSGDAINLIAGAPENLDIALFDDQYFPDSAPPPFTGTLDSKPHSLDDLEKFDGGENVKFFSDLRAKFGVNALLQMRVQEPSGVCAWLNIVRHEGEFNERDRALMESLAPELRSVLQIYVVKERYRYSASITSEATERLSFGWLVLDEDGIILDTDNQAAAILKEGRVLAKTASGRLYSPSSEDRRELTRLITEVSKSPKPSTRAVRLSHEPWFDLLVSRARGNFMASPARPAVVAYIHGDSWSTADRCDQLAELFELYPREAQLALALSRGMTIAEAGKAFGLTEGTARNYTKAIYAKTGARGLPDLVRIVMRSVLAFAPDGSGT